MGLGPGTTPCGEKVLIAVLALWPCLRTSLPGSDSMCTSLFCFTMCHVASGRPPAVSVPFRKRSTQPEGCGACRPFALCGLWEGPWPRKPTLTDETHLPLSLLRRSKSLLPPVLGCICFPWQLWHQAAGQKCWDFWSWSKVTDAACGTHTLPKPK